MGADSISAAVVVCITVVVIAFNVSWLACASRKQFPPYGDRDAAGRRPPAYLKVSAVFAAPATLVVAVVLPVYAYYIAEWAFTAAAVVFLTLEMLWIPAVFVGSVLLTRVVLFAAAAALTATLVLGIEHYASLPDAEAADPESESDGRVCAQTADLVYFVLGMAFPMGNVWLNDLFYFTYMWEQFKSGGGGRRMGGVIRLNT
jgi:hypothetical protein